MGRLRILLMALAVAGLAGCGEAPAPKPAAQGEALKTAAVELRDVELTTSAEAVMEAVHQSTVSAQIAGRVSICALTSAGLREEGQVIVRIDERVPSQRWRRVEAQVAEARPRSANARANYERSGNCSRRNSSARRASTRRKRLQGGAGLASVALIAARARQPRAQLRTVRGPL